MAKRYTDIEGWFDFEDLYSQYAEALKDGHTFVEIGVWQGRSFCFLGELLKNANKKVKMYAVDTFKGSETEEVHQQAIKKLGGSTLQIFEGNVADMGLKDLVTVIPEDSATAASKFADGSIDILFIDGDHTLVGVLSDLERWYPKVKSGGIISGHDIPCPSVLAAVTTFFQNLEMPFYKASSACWVVKKP